MPHKRSPGYKNPHNPHDRGQGANLQRLVRGPAEGGGHQEEDRTARMGGGVRRVQRRRGVKVATLI